MKRLLLPVCIMSFLIGVTVSCKQGGHVEYNRFKDSINNKLAVLSRCDSNKHEAQVVNPDSLVNIVADELVRFYKSKLGHHFQPDDFPLLDPLMTKDGTFLVLDINYYTSTYGRIHNPVIIKKDKRINKIFNLTGTLAGFYEFYRLKDEIYLCVGEGVRLGDNISTSFYVIDFATEDAQLVPAFSDKSNFVTNWVTGIDFDREKNVLTLKVEQIQNDYSGGRCLDYLEKEGDYSCFNIECSDHYEEKGKTIVSILKTRYDGTKFVKP